MSSSSSSSVNFGSKLLRVVKSAITRTQVSLDSKLDPCILVVPMKSIPVNETSLVTVTRYEVRSLRCEPLTLPFAFELPRSGTVQLAVDYSVPCIPFEDAVIVSSRNIEEENLNTLDPLADDSLSQSPFSPTILIEASPEPLPTHPKQPPTTFSTTSPPSSFLAFLEASHLEASNRLLAERSASATLDLGCAQFNSAYYRRHLSPPLIQLSTTKKSKKPFCWRTTLDEIMKESAEECDETLDELVVKSGTEFSQDIVESSPSNSSHSRSSSVSSYTTCIGSLVPSLISSSGQLQQKDISKTITISETLSKSLDSQSNCPLPYSFLSFESSSFLDFIESSNQKMINRMQQEKSQTMDIGCSQFNSAQHRRHLPSSLPPLKSRTVCWKLILDQMMREEEYQDTSIDQSITEPIEIFHPTIYTSSSHVRSSSFSSDITVVDTSTLIPFSKDGFQLSSQSPVEL